MVLIPLAVIFAYGAWRLCDGGPLEDGALVYGTVATVHAFDSETAPRTELVVVLDSGGTVRVMPSPSLVAAAGSRVRLRERMDTEGRVVSHVLVGLE